MRRWLSAVALGLLAACSSTPEAERGDMPPAIASPALEPTGTFDFSTSVDGTPVTGTIMITRAENEFGGTITTSVTDPVSVRTVTVAGQSMTVVADTPDGPVTLIMNFMGNDFSGTWALGEMSGTMSGRRRP